MSDAQKPVTTGRKTRRRIKLLHGNPRESRMATVYLTVLMAVTMAFFLTLYYMPGGYKSLIIAPILYVVIRVVAYYGDRNVPPGSLAIDISGLISSVHDPEDGDENGRAG